VNVLIIPEDFRKDQYVVGPIIRRMFAEVGKPNANVRVCLDPLMGGISEATKWQRIKDVLDRYRGMVQMFLLLVDRDGVAGRRETLNGLEERAAAQLGDGKTMLGENAWQEIEVWALAGQDLPGDWQWQAIRADVHPKEVYFEPLARQRGLTKEPGEGRTTMGREGAQNYNRVRSRCKEDIQSLEIRLKTWFAEN
jgi:hypothetical protein